MMRVLVFNPNTNAVMTEELVVSARLALPGVAVEGRTAVQGAPYIASSADLGVAGAVAVEMLNGETTAGYDAVVLACFGDPALAAVRAGQTVPVFGMAECVFSAAGRDGAAFAVVTGGRDWPPLIEHLARAGGYGDRLVEVRSIEAFGAAARAAPEATLEALVREARAVEERHGPVRIVLGGTGLSPWYASLSAALGRPVFCSWRETLLAVGEM